jgi:hypothetical protein
VDDRSWAIRQMIVETSHWHSGEGIWIPVSQIERISFRETKVIVPLTKAEIEKAAEHQLAKLGTG